MEVTKTISELGVPDAEFIEDVDAYMAGKDMESAVKMLQDRYQQYKLAESRVQQMRLRLQTKMPDIKKGLEMVTLLCDKQGSGEELKLDFELSDNLYAKAKVKDATAVNIWLGANVMLEYDINEAKELLTRNLANCVSNLESTRQDMTFLRNQITITEVSIARVYNWDVKRRREAKAKEALELKAES